MKKLFLLLLVFSLCLSIIGCGAKQTTDNYVPTGDALVAEDYVEPENKESDNTQITELNLTFYKDKTMNPYKCDDFTNRALFSLIYQGLFTVDSEYHVEPMLCSYYIVSEDMYSYTFYVDENATFSDGTSVTPADVVASLNAALDSIIYEGRFFYIQSVNLDSDGGISIYLYHPYEDLPLLLDVPIVKASQVDSDRPLGTGPYSLVSTLTGGRLVRRNNWWCSAKLPVDLPYINLIEATSNTQIRDEFEFRDLNLVCADPGSGLYADFRCDYELWDCENGYFLYLACSSQSEIFDIQSVRSALTYGIDRDYLAENTYRGHARSASLPASPQSPYYNVSLANQYSYNPEKFAFAVQNSGCVGKTVKLLVNGEDSLRVIAAKEIAKMLEAAGLDVEIITPASGKFEETLIYGKYDLFLGTTQLSPNMDLSQFFYEWGYLSYTGTDNEVLYTLSLDCLENSGNYLSLYRQVMDDGMLCPILFRSYAIYATRGLFDNLTPSRDCIFYYSIGKSMVEALIEYDY